MNTTRRRLPTLYQTKVLRMVAQSGCLMKTKTPERGIVWAVANGFEVSEKCADALIQNGWVIPNHDGLGLFEESQSYVLPRHDRLT